MNPQSYITSAYSEASKNPLSSPFLSTSAYSEASMNPPSYITSAYSESRKNLPSPPPQLNLSLQ